MQGEGILDVDTACELFGQAEKTEKVTIGGVQGGWPPWLPRAQSPH